MAGPGDQDPYRYFRIEARELVDALAAGVSGLRTDTHETGSGTGTDSGSGTGTGTGGRTRVDTAAGVGALLRHAHTLKGAARVVAQIPIADAAHALEDLLGPFRGSAEAVPIERVDEMLGLVDGIVTLVEAIDAAPVPGPRGPREDAPGAGFPSAPARASGPAPASASDPAVAFDRPPEPLLVGAVAPVTVRADLTEVDDVIRGVNRTMVQVAVLRECGARVSALREHPALAGELELAVATLGRLLAGAGDRVERELRQVHDTAERLRLMPLATIVPDLERAARDVAAAQHKRVVVDVEGEQVRLDVPMMAVVTAALQQIVRNAVAHGIETPQERAATGKSAVGRIRLQVQVRGSTVRFRCADDGAGVNLDAVREALRRKGVARAAEAGQDELLELLLTGGVSTAASVTGVSGRGIGLDVVRDAVHRVGGQVRISTVRGAGTTIDLTTPLSLTAQELVLVDAGRPVGLPMRAVREVIRIRAEDVVSGPDGATCAHDGRMIPFLHLASVLDARPPAAHEAWSVLIVEGSSGTAAVGVARVLGTAEPAVRPLPRLLPAADLVAGVWLDVDGTPRLVLDPDAVVASAGRSVAEPPVPARLAPVLVVDDSLTTRMLEQSILESAGYEVALASSAEEGLAMAARNVYSVVLVDVEMPGMDGFGFVQQVRSRPDLRYLPCILVTSRASPEDRRRGQEAGASGHIDKGEFHQGTLLETITKLAVR